MTSIAGDEEEVEEAKPKSPILDNFRSLNTSALSDSGEGENVSTSSSYLESLRGTRENITKGAEEPIGEIVMEGTTAPSTSPQNSSHLRTSEGLQSLPFRGSFFPIPAEILLYFFSIPREFELFTEIDVVC